jgi:hypothetical protein
VGREHELDRLRRYARGLLAADGALFPTADKSSVTLACAEMVSADHNDDGLGDFSAQLLEQADGAGPLAGCLLEAVHTEWPHDPLTAMAWPLLDTAGREWRRNPRARLALGRTYQRAFREQVESAARDLATHERAQGNRLRTLQRIVQFSCVAIHSHAQALGAGGALGDRVPALLAAAGVKGSPLAEASERSVDRICARFEAWLAQQVAGLIAAGKPLSGGDGPDVPDSLDGRTVRSYLAGIGTASREHQAPDKDTLDDRMADFERYRKALEGAKVSDVLGHTLVAAHVREYASGGPRSFLQTLSRRVGLLFPPFQGRSREKRVHPSVPVLDMLVRACVPAGNMVPLATFLERLWLRFGLIVGGRSDDSWDDSSFLQSRGLAVDVSALEENMSALVDQLLLIGLARAHADNVTFVGDPNV